MIYKRLLVIFLVFLLILNIPNILGLGGDDGGSGGTGDTDGGEPSLGGPDGGSPGLGGPDGGQPGLGGPSGEPGEEPTPGEPTPEEGISDQADGNGAQINNPPVLNPIGNKQVNENQLLQFTITASDPDNDHLTFLASNLPSGASFLGNTFSWTPNFNQAGTYSVTFTVSDSEFSNSETITITVINVNRAPTISGLPDLNLNEDSQLVNIFDLDNFANDPDNNALTYPASSSNNIIVSINSDNQVTITPRSNFNGQEIITFTVSDSQLTDTDSVLVTVNPINDAPILSIPDISFDEDTTFSFDLDNFVSDVDIATNNDVLTFSVSGNNQISVTISPDNIVRLTPQANFNGQETLIFTATDLANAFSSDSVLVTVNPVNDNPILAFIKKIFVLAGDRSNKVELNLDNFSSDVDIATNNDRLSYSFTQQQDSAFNINLQNNIATIQADNPSFTIGSGTLFDGIIYERTTETVTFTARDLAGASDSDDLTLVVGNAPYAIISYNNLNVREGQEFELSAERSFDIDGNIAAIEWDLGDGTKSTKEKLKHSYNNEGSFKVTLTITDNDGLIGTQSIEFNTGIQLNKQHKFSIGTRFNDYSAYKPGDTYENYIKIRNIGNLKETNIQARLIVSYLGINQPLQIFNLDPYQIKWIPVIFDIPKDAVNGEYLAKITLQNKNFNTFSYFTILIG